jgi:tRNA (mo5U34)-methyltransferase
VILRPLRATPEDARRLIEESDFVWYQRFPLAEGVMAPGRRDIGSQWRDARLPSDLSGRSVLDIGTTNGGAAFTAERLGAKRVVATDILGPHTFGFDTIKRHLGSAVEFVDSTVYELPEALVGEQFDVVVFWGVLYHLRHPLLALDVVRRVARDVVSIETAVHVAKGSVSRFFRYDDFYRDGTNWFLPSVSCTIDWCGSAGLSVDLVAGPTASSGDARATFLGTVTEPEFSKTAAGYERPIIPHVVGGFADSREQRARNQLPPEGMSA